MVTYMDIVFPRDKQRATQQRKPKLRKLSLFVDVIQNTRAFVIHIVCFALSIGLTL